MAPAGAAVLWAAITAAGLGLTTWGLDRARRRTEERPWSTDLLRWLDTGRWRWLAGGLAGGSVAVAAWAAYTEAPLGQKVAAIVVAIVAWTALGVVSVGSWWPWIVPVAPGAGVLAAIGGFADGRDALVVGTAALAALGVACVVVPRWWPDAAMAPASIALAGSALLVQVWRDGHGPGALAGAVVAAAVLLAGLVAWRWLNWGWFLFLAGGAAAAGLLAGAGGNDALLRTGFVVAVVTVLLGIAFQFGKGTLRLSVVAGLLACTVALASVGRGALECDATTEANELAKAVDPRATEVACGGKPSPFRLRDEAADALVEARAAQVEAAEAAAADAEEAVAAAGAAREAAAARVDSAPDGTDVGPLIADLEARLVAEQRATDAAADAAERLTDAEEALTEAREQAGSIEATVETPVHRLVARGADEVVADLLRPFAGDGVAARLGDVGWVLLGLAALFAYRGIEILNNDRYGAPVHVDDVTITTLQPEGSAGKAPTAEALSFRLRSRIKATELFEPATIPGGVAGEELVTVLKDTTTVPGAAPIAAVIKLVRATAFPVPGVTASTSYAGRDGRHQLEVVLTTTRRGAFLRAFSADSASLEDAVDEAAAFVALDVLNFTKLNPDWNRWRGARAGAAFRRLRRVEADGRGPKRLSLDEQIAELEQARTECPGAALVAVALAHRYDSKARRGDALELHLATRLRHPRFFAARYRFATSLSMASETDAGGTGWWTFPAAQREAIVELLLARGLLRDSAIADLLRSAGPTSERHRRDAAIALLELARRETRWLRRTASRAGMTLAALRPGERSEWLRTLRNAERRRALHDQVATLRAIVEVRLALAELDAPAPDRKTIRARVARHLQVAERAATSPQATAPALYNTACLYALLASRAKDLGGGWDRVDATGQALDLLGRSFDRSGGVTSRTWVRRDPDLRALHANPRFERRIRLLPEEDPA